MPPNAPSPLTPPDTIPLYTTAEVQQQRQELAALGPVVDWLHDFLAKPHKELGRSGPVCPFAPEALRRGTIHLAAIRSRPDPDPSEIESRVRGYRDLLLGLEPREGARSSHNAIVLVFPDIPAGDAPTLIDDVQRTLKPFFLEEGLMIGEFHPLNDSPGLRNPDFRPLRAPAPIIAMRRLVDTDLPFLMRESDPPGMRIRFLETYQQRLGEELSAEQRLLAAAALAQARLEAAGSSLDTSRS